MSTSDHSNYDYTVKKLESLIEFSTKFSSTSDRIIYDTVLIDDPFKKREVQNLVPEKNRGEVIELIQGFEDSLERLSNSRYISRETILRNYRNIIDKAIETAMQKRERKCTNGLDPELYGYSLEADKVKKSITGVTNDKKEAGPRLSNKQLKAEVPSKNKIKRTSISKEARDFLENVFSSKRTPNSKERKMIAEKCGLTPVQVRVWFTNKRMRSK